MRRKLSSLDAGFKGPLTLFFAPEGRMSPHHSALLLLARSLQEQGQRVLIAHCLNLFDRCPVFDALHLPNQLTPAQRDQICYECARGGLERANSYGLPGVDLRSMLSRGTLVKIREALSETPDNLLDFTFDGVRFGELCAMNLALRFKISELQRVTPSVRAAWVEYLQTSLQSYVLMNEILRLWEVTSVAQYNDYGISLGVRMAAEKHGIRDFTISHPAHKNIDRQNIWITRRTVSESIVAFPEVWKQWKALPLPPKQVRDAMDDIFYRFRSAGSHNYSPSRGSDADWAARLSLDSKRRLIVAYTSSLDELTSMATLLKAVGSPWPEVKKPFSDQIAWLQSLVRQVEESQDLQLVIRVHPREGTLKNKKLESQHLGDLRRNFSGTLRHVRVAWPDDPVSSYDLAEMADVALICSSSIGLEMARLGMPVLITFPDWAAFPPDDFGYFATEPEAYARLVEKVAASPHASWEKIRHAYRFYNLSTQGNAIDVSDVVPRPDFEDLPAFRLPSRATDIKRAFAGESALDINRQRLAEAQTTTSLKEEREAIADQLRRFLHVIITGEMVETPPPKATWQRQSNEIRYQCAGKSWQRHSPMLSRICALLDDPNG